MKTTLDRYIDELDRTGPKYLYANILKPAAPVSIRTSHYSTIDRLGLAAIVLAFLALLWL
jgi:hypothetical protein